MPSEHKVVTSIRLLLCGKAPRPDAIPSEIYKICGQLMISKFSELFQVMWTTENITQDFKDICIVHIYKEEGNGKACDNDHGISILSIAWKILASVLLNFLIVLLKQGHLPESQYGFRAGQETHDIISTVHQIQEVGTTMQSLLHLLRSNKGLWCCEPGWSVEDHGQPWLPREVNKYHPTLPWWNAC